MAGIYVHIPFCKQACSYCNFYFTTNLKYKNDVLNAILHEIEMRSEDLQVEPISTIYFGGGTPSLFSAEEIGLIIDKVKMLAHQKAYEEITLEANPDDIPSEYLQDLKSIGITRLSLGIQSFNDTYLQFMNRAHTAREANDSIIMAQNEQFDLSIDLIYGLPGMTLEDWKTTINKFLSHNIPHLSAYALTLEPKTAFAHDVAVGNISQLLDEDVYLQFKELVTKLESSGYEHYEISNFSQPGNQAIHNSNYWRGVPYLGIGPSAHSYDIDTRRWNISNQAKYVKAVKNDQPYFEVEVLTEKDKFNEYLMTGLRTSSGCRLSYIENQFGEQVLAKLISQIEPYIIEGLVKQQQDTIMLEKKGKFIADNIISNLFRT